jgi:hypothetical protein
MTPMTMGPMKTKQKRKKLRRMLAARSVTLACPD